VSWAKYRYAAGIAAFFYRLFNTRQKLTTEDIVVQLLSRGMFSFF